MAAAKECVDAGDPGRDLLVRTSGNAHRHAGVTAALAEIVLGIAGCGGGGSSASTPAQSKPTQLYTVALSGRAEPRAGAAGGSGFAIIAFHGPRTVCWRFAHLHGFTTATHAAIYAGKARKTGIVAIALTGPPRLHHRGCVAMAAATSRRIMHAPATFYVNVFADRFPQGAVRGQL